MTLDKVSGIGIIYNARTPQSQELAKSLIHSIGSQAECWISSTVDMENNDKRLSKTDLLVSVGGDGTILRVAGVAAPLSIPILGVNTGRVGFMTELKAGDATKRIKYYLSGKARVEVRSMLQVKVPSTKGNDIHRRAEIKWHVLNDIVVGRSRISRLLHIEAQIDGTLLTTYNADAVIVSTATGSTGYSLSADGPILYPQSKDMVLTAVAPHLSLAPALVIPSTATIQLTHMSDEPASLSLDGLSELPLAQGDTVEVKSSPHTVRFLRALPSSTLYASLTRRLGLEGRPFTQNPNATRSKIV
jgi:NAD+ kinase